MSTSSNTFRSLSPSRTTDTDGSVAPGLDFTDTRTDFAITVGGVSAAVSKTAAAPIERVKLLIQNQVYLNPFNKFFQIFPALPGIRIGTCRYIFKDRHLHALSPIKLHTRSKSSWLLDVPIPENVVTATNPLPRRMRC